ncbi:MAG: hypothetical protein ACRELS_11695 [Candidatus Rokuibacteriota bacterium]
MKRLVLGMLVVAATAAPVCAQVRVGIDIGIHLPGPPVLEVIAGAPVYYAPRAPANVFFYSSRYWVFVESGWHVGPTWTGPWVVVEPVHVPVPILRVPIRYYRHPPGHWKASHHEGPPQWAPAYGREWREEAHERQWREREEHWGRGEGKGKGCPPGLAKQGRC